MTDLTLKSLLFASLALAIACGGDKDAEKDPIIETDDTDTCVSGISSTFPAADATGVFFRTPIEVKFNQAESASTATLTLTDAGGAEVAGSTSFSTDGKTATFEPSANLAASTQYTLTVDYTCDKTAEIQFTTSETGAPVDGATLINNVYAIDITSGRFTEPPGLADAIPGLLQSAGDIPSILISASAFENNQLTIIGALGNDEGTGQDLCTESISFPETADYSSNPFFSIEGEDVTLTVADFSLEIASLNVSGAFTPDADAIEGVALSLFADTTALNGLIEGFEDICAAAALFQISCVSCSGSGTDDVTCLSLKADSIEATLEADIDGLQIITAEQAEACENPT